MTKRIDYYAGKASARKSACGELDEALCALASAEQRFAASGKRLMQTEREAQESLDARLAELERQYQADIATAQHAASARVHGARSEHGTAAALLVKAREAVTQARERLLRLVPTHDEVAVDEEARTHDEARASA